MLQKISISNKCCSFELTNNQRIQKKILFMVSTKMLSSTATVFIIDNNEWWNVSWAAIQHIRMISEGLFVTEDWNNDAVNSVLITGINYIYIENNK